MTRLDRMLNELHANPSRAVRIVDLLLIARPWRKREHTTRAGVVEEFETLDLASGEVLAEVYEFMGRYSWRLGERYNKLQEAGKLTLHSPEPFDTAQAARDDVDAIIQAQGHRLAGRRSRS